MGYFLSPTLDLQPIPNKLAAKGETPMYRFLFMLMLSTLISCGLFGSSKDEVKAEPEEQEALSREEQAKAEGLFLKQFDLNRDNTPDVFKYFKLVPNANAPEIQTEQIVRKEIDINYDGKVDIIRHYDDTQQVASEETDLDFDGRIDSKSVYVNGGISHKELDTNYDDKADIIKHYKKGKVVRIETDTDLNGFVDRWEYYENDKLTRTGLDTDGDGNVDVWQKPEEKKSDETEG
ncbi:MAG: hypothetical protein CMH60_05310 [Myxococcales bacterium]|nr:hypothetical protein [Myxococcales bacterium]